MTFFDQKLEQLSKVLADNNLGLIYDFKHETDNGLILPFFARYMDILNKENIDFCVTTDLAARAGIIYKNNLIFVSHGLLDRLCKLSSLIFSSGVLNGKQKPLQYFDLHYIQKPFKGFNNQEGRDETQSENHLFLFIFDSLMEFIIRHELGHYKYNHGERASICDDIEGHRKIINDDVIKSHCRELVADNFAFFWLKSNIEHTFKTSNVVISDISKEFKTKHGPAVVSLMLAGSYFSLMDGTNSINHFESTHPISPVRIHHIFASYLEGKIDTEHENIAENIMKLALILIEEVFLYADKDFKLHWAETTSSPEMVEWHKHINEEYQNWCKRKKYV